MREVIVLRMIPSSSEVMEECFDYLSEGAYERCLLCGITEWETAWVVGDQSAEPAFNAVRIPKTRHWRRELKRAAAKVSVQLLSA